jgi:hypothetical protein
LTLRFHRGLEGLAECFTMPREPCCFAKACVAGKCGAGK